MSEMLFPVIDVPELVEDEELYDSQYRSSVKWDFELGDFVRDGANKLVECDGQEAFKVWCVKIVLTERFTCLAYDDDIGTEIEDALQERVYYAVESALERTITEALMVNPRTEYVRDFDFEAEGDELWLSFTVKGVDWDEFPIRVKLKGGEEEDG